MGQIFCFGGCGLEGNGAVNQPKEEQAEAYQIWSLKLINYSFLHRPHKEWDKLDLFVAG